MKQIILDTETTGLYCNKGHRIIEIGCMELINRKLTKNIFHTYLNPERFIDDSAIEVTGINTKFLLNKSKFKNIADKFINFILNANELIIHNAMFDIGFINKELQRINHKITNIADHIKIFDTLTYARILHPGKKNNLDILCKRYNINPTSREKHGALIDAKLLSQVFLKMTSSQYNINYINKKTTKIKTTKYKIIKLIKAKTQEISQHNTYIKHLKSMHLAN